MDRRSLGRANLSVLNEFTEGQLMSIWAEIDYEKGHYVLTDAGCCLWQGSTQNGYPCMSRGHAKSKLKLHQLALFMRTREIVGPGEVASHLCHNKLCINPSHLIRESIQGNNSRKGCIWRVQDRNGEHINCCPHLPRCLARDAENLPAGWIETYYV
jgi:hypothetical protein